MVHPSIDTRSPALRVIVTRPAAQAMGWVADLRRDGVDAVALPLIDIAPPAQPALVDQAWHGLPRFALVFFVSANAVQYFFGLRPQGQVWPEGTRAAAPGPGTAAALRAQGLPEGRVVAPDPASPSFDSEALWARVKDESWAGRQVLVVRGEGGRDWLADQLVAAGATLQTLVAYERKAPELSTAGAALLEAARAAPRRHLWLFSSSEAVRQLVSLWPGGVPAGARALATHPRIAAAVHEAGFTDVVVSRPAPASVLQMIQAASIQSPLP